MKTTATILFLACALGGSPATAQEKALNLYSARHYQTDEALFRAWQGERPADWAAFAATPFRSG